MIVSQLLTDGRMEVKLRELKSTVTHANDHQMYTRKAFVNADAGTQTVKFLE